MRFWIGLLLAASGASAVVADDFEADVARLQATRQAYAGATNKFLDDVDSTVALLQGLKSVAAWADELKTKYRADVESKSERGRQLEAAYAALLRDVNLFVRKRESFEKTSRRDFDQALLRAEKLSEQAAKSRARPALDGARGELAKARKIADVALVLSGKDEAAPLARRLKEALTALERRDAELQSALVADVHVPADAYHATDASELKTLIRDAWRKAYPQDEILRVVLPSNAWQRTIRFSWDRGAEAWDVGDVMVLPARVIVKHDDDSAMIYMAYVNRRPRASSQSAGVKTKSAEYVQEQIPLAKLD